MPSRVPLQWTKHGEVPSLHYKYTRTLWALVPHRTQLVQWPLYCFPVPAPQTSWVRHRWVPDPHWFPLVACQLSSSTKSRRDGRSPPYSIVLSWPWTHQLTRTTRQCPDDRCRVHTRHSVITANCLGLSHRTPSLHAGASLKYCVTVCVYVCCPHVYL